MGNSLGGKKAKIMKVDGETFKLRTPVQAGEVVKNHPGLVLLDSAAVKQFGVRARPMEAHQNLRPKRVYFLVDLPPHAPPPRGPRRVRSGIKVGAKERLESLLLARRSVSDLTEVRTSHGVAEEYKRAGPEGGSAMRVRMTLPKAEVERLVRESGSEGEAAERILAYCKANAGVREVGVAAAREQKRVSFLPMNQGPNQIAVHS